MASLQNPSRAQTAVLAPGMASEVKQDRGLNSSSFLIFACTFCSHYFLCVGPSKHQWRKIERCKLAAKSSEQPLLVSSQQPDFAGLCPSRRHCYSSHSCASELSPANGITNAIISTDSPRSFHSITIRFPILAASKSI